MFLQPDEQLPGGFLEQMQDVNSQSRSAIYCRPGRDLYK